MSRVACCFYFHFEIICDENMPTIVSLTLCKLSYRNGLYVKCVWHGSGSRFYWQISIPILNVIALFVTCAWECFVHISGLWTCCMQQYPHLRPLICCIVDSEFTFKTSPIFNNIIRNKVHLHRRFQYRHVCVGLYLTAWSEMKWRIKNYSPVLPFRNNS